MTWNEAALHRWLARHLAPRGLALGFGNDAAVLRAAAGRTVLCSDQVVAGVHFESGVPARRVGRKAVDRALSDLAASAARPRAVLLSGAFAPEVAESWIRALLRGARDEARRFGAELVGGDLACSPAGTPAVVSVTACGVLAPGDPAVGRQRARPGQVLVLTGAVGGSGLGRHLAIEPRVRAGRWLARAGATAMMDVSDGLALDLSRLARASGVRLVVERVPLHPDARRAARRSGRSALAHGLADGEDHELVATLSAADWARARRRRAGAGVAVAAIGRVERGAGLWLPGEVEGTVRNWDGQGGWIHGAG